MDEITTNMPSTQSQIAMPAMQPVHWDPVAGAVSPTDLADIASKDNALAVKFQVFKNDPGRINRNIMLFSLFGVAGIMVSGLILYLFPGFENGDNSGNFIYPAILGFIPLSMYIYKIKELQKDLINLAIADRFGWLYNPEADTSKWNQLRAIYPELFKLGNADQYFDNEFWGTYDNPSKSFWLSRFHYTINQGKTSSSYLNSVCAFQLSKLSSVDFCLVPQNVLTEIETAISSKVITTESTDFNKEFHINYKGDRGIVGADIFQVLSPETQEKIMEHRKAYGKFKMVIRLNTVYFSYDKEYKTTFTNFRKAVLLDERDATAITDRIRSAVALAEEIVTCLDNM